MAWKGIETKAILDPEDDVSCDSGVTSFSRHNPEAENSNITTVSSDDASCDSGVASFSRHNAEVENFNITTVSSDDASCDSGVASFSRHNAEAENSNITTVSSDDVSCDSGIASFSRHNPEAENSNITTVSSDDASCDSGVASFSRHNAEVENFNITTAIEGRLQWELGTCLGEGSFGKVIKAKHLTDKCDYAVKLMPCISGEREKYQKRELKLLTEQVSSPTYHINIVKYYDSWRYEGTTPPLLCIRMELCDISLETLLREEKSVVDNPQFYQNVFPQILRGLEYLHKIHWVHRDIYPPNILLAMPEHDSQPFHSRVVKIADFGLARELDQRSSLTLSDLPKEVLSAVGNKFYQAPEMKRVSGEELKYDYKVDLYSAGLVLYRLCRYFENSDVISLELQSIQHTGLVDKSKLCHQHEFLHQLLDDLLKQNPEERLSASQALARFEMSSSPALQDPQASASSEKFPLHSLSEPDGSKTPSIFARKISASSYVRVHAPCERSYDALLTCLSKDLEINDIECFDIIEESDDCRQKIRTNSDLDILLSSANRKHCKVKLVVEPKSEEEPDLC